ncbi:MAG TPA: hypothetical protein VFV83_09965 [Chthoniobacteraceae bacterium]|nr:hypothetical protein [Chthoniobacteraceae bacterium]
MRFVPIRALGAVSAIAAVTWSSPQPIHAANSTGTIARELQAERAKYDTQIAALERTRETALAAARSPYVADLDAAGRKAVSAGREEEGKAIEAEKKAVLAGRDLDSIASPLLPRELMRPRGAYLREFARVDRDFSERMKKPASNYLRALSFLEAKATTSKQAEIVEQIRAEQRRADPDRAGPSGPIENNVVVNGDFADTQPNGMPAHWGLNGPGKAAVTTEDGVKILRVASTSNTETWLRQPVKVPAGSKELRVQVRVRAPDLKTGGYGIVIAQLDGTSSWKGQEQVCWSTTRQRSWKDLEGKIKLAPEIAEIVVRCDIKGAIATVDFADVRAAFE